MSSLAGWAQTRGVEEVLHFTTDKGVLGSLRSGQLLSRRQVEDDPDLAFIFNAVWPVKLPEWAGHISLSLTEINRELFDRAERNLPDRWWAIMSFGASIIDDPGVVFTTTNNAYNDVCRRAGGLDGLQDMFSPSVPWGYYGAVARRTSAHAHNAPTHRQAEVLYPTAIDLANLRRIYVRAPEHRRMIRAWCSTFDYEPPEVEIAPERFT